MNEIHRSPFNAKAIVGAVLIAIGILFSREGHARLKVLLGE
jgi:hypothetical protein